MCAEKEFKKTIDKNKVKKNFFIVKLNVHILTINITKNEICLHEAVLKLLYFLVGIKLNNYARCCKNFISSWPDFSFSSHMPIWAELLKICTWDCSGT